jgi:hypothetical protein
MAAPRPRVAVVVSYGLSVRYLVPTGLLDEIGAVAQPVVALSWDDPELTEVLEAHGAEVVRLPAPRVDHEYRRVERLLDVGFQQRLASPTAAISRRWRRRTSGFAEVVVGSVRHARDWTLSRIPGREAAWERQLAAMEDHHTNLPEFAAFLDEHAIDAVVSFTPYHRGDHLLLLAAGRRELPTLVSMISFDNPTTRGRMPALDVTDRVLVWNRFNHDELVRAYPSLHAADVRITGAPQFDLHHDRAWIIDDAAWRDELGLPADRPIVLHGAGPAVLVPGEEHLVEAIAQAIDDGRIPGDPVLLVRAHPADDANRWRALERPGRVVVAPAWGRADGGLAWPSDHDTAVQLSTLAHAAVHVSVCSSMAIDGAAFDRPTVAPTTVPGSHRHQARRIRSFYRQEHWQPIAASGAVATAATLPELEAAITRHLADPARGRPQRRAVLETMLTFTDGASSRRVAAELADLLASSSPLAAPEG